MARKKTKFKKTFLTLLVVFGLIALVSFGVKFGFKQSFELDDYSRGTYIFTADSGSIIGCVDTQLGCYVEDYSLICPESHPTPFEARCYKYKPDAVSCPDITRKINQIPSRVSSCEFRSNYVLGDRNENGVILGRKDPSPQAIEICENLGGSVSGINCNPPEGEVWNGNSLEENSQEPYLDLILTGVHHIDTQGGSSWSERDRSKIQAVYHAIPKQHFLDNETIQELEDLRLTAEERAERIKALTQNIGEQIALIEQMELAVEEKALLIAELTSTLDEQVQMINALSENIEEKAHFVSLLTAENEEQAELIRLMELSFSEQADIISALGNTIEEDAEIISNLDLSVNEQAELISRLRLKIEEEQELVSKLELKIEEQQSLLEELGVIRKDRTWIYIIVASIISASLGIGVYSNRKKIKKLAKKTFK